jgi:hypothetical protein
LLVQNKGGDVLDFSLVRKKEMTIKQLTEGVTREDLVQLTNEMIDLVLELIKDCTDSDVVFEPEDPEADDPYAEDKSEVTMPWNLGHVIVHITASCEESATLATELARGVEYHGRSRSEVPWRAVRQISQCRKRLDESRRMCLASLEMWPDNPHMDNVYVPWEGMPPINAITRYVLGLMHADSHLDQIKDIVSQSQST